jgi:hypothetical protein
VREPLEPLDIRALLHPAEHSRLLIALSSSAIVFGVAAMMVYAHQAWIGLASIGVVLGVFGGLVWLTLQVIRSRLLGGAVCVSEATLPELQSVFDEVRTRLNYLKRVDVYVMDKVAGGSAMTSYLGTRLIQIEGGLVAELLGEEHHAELTYLIGRHIGQLKARHQRLLPIFLVISLVDSLQFLKLFLAPYYRATAKSGDQIAAACCGDIRATTGMMNRLLVGKELGPRLVVKGVLDQAATVRRRWVPRLAQLFMSEPHATNRYLNLLAFFARVAPAEIHGWRATLDEATASRLAAVLAASPNRRPPRLRPSPMSTLLATLASGGVLALSGWLIFGGLAPAANSTGGGNTSAAGNSSTGEAGEGQAPAGQTSAGQTSAGQAPTGGQAATVSQQLLGRISRFMPAAFVAECVTVGVSAVDARDGVDGEVACSPGVIGASSFVTYEHYTKPDLMQNAYRSLARGLPSGKCLVTGGRGSYWRVSPSQPDGDYACYDTGHHHVFLWTDKSLSVLSYAESDSKTLAKLYKWWNHHSEP